MFYQPTGKPLPTGHMLSLVESAQDSKTTHKNKLKNQMEHE